MHDFARSYFKLYISCMLACVFHIFFSYVVCFTGAHLLGEFYTDYTGPMIIAAILCIPAAIADTAPKETNE